MKQKHAVCIMAHKNVEQLNILIEILDHERIDIYLHIDAKSNIVPNKVIAPKLATLTEVARHDTRWGDVSQMYTEMELFRAVNKSNIDYCRVHLISGEDLPVWKIDDIIAFFDKECNRDVEYIIANEYSPAEPRLRYYWLCTRHMRGALVYKIIRHTTLLLQRLFRVNRLKYCDLPFRMGPNWVSLTPKAINHIVNVFPRYERNFCYSVCVDEVYKQMLLGGAFHLSENGNMHYAKFQPNVSSPVIINSQMTDDLLGNPNFCFARKFDITVDREAVEKVVKWVKD